MGGPDVLFEKVEGWVSACRSRHGDRRERGDAAAVVGEVVEQIDVEPYLLH
jgi:hypothetical protein